MRCRYCRSEIGWRRQILDREYCCDEHREQDRVPASVAARESLLYGEELLWHPNQPKKKSQPISPAGSAALLALGAFGLVVLWFLPNTAEPPPRRSNDVVGPAIPKGFADLLPESSGNTWRQDFRAGLGEWAGGSRSASDWSVSAGMVRPRGLRLLERSRKMRDYQLEFEGVIERRAMNWTIRAPDLRNYYAYKLLAYGENSSPRGEIVHVVVLNGEEQQRVRLPLPVTLRRGVPYRVRVSVEGQQFLTYLDGQVVDSWSDARLSSGGIGFFSEKGEASALRWVSLSKPAGFLDRLTPFSLLTAPSGLL